MLPLSALPAPQFLAAARCLPSSCRWATAGLLQLASWSSISNAAAAPAAAGGAPAARPALLAPGATYSLTKQFSAADVAAFTGISGDGNPIHVAPSAAAAAGLPGCILPGLLSASLFPAIIGSTFPGAVYASQTLKFKRYALVGDMLTATLRVEKLSGSRVSFLTECRSDSSGEIVVEGTALAIIPQQQQGQQGRHGEEVAE